MNRTIVSIISEQTVPNYIFIKEMMSKGDKLMFISSKRFENRISWIQDALNVESDRIIPLLLSNPDDEERWQLMSSSIEKALDKETKYLVNLTGGTKYMSLAVQRVFEKFDSEFYYIPYPKNSLLTPMGTDEHKPIKYRLSIKEYLTSYGVQYKEKQRVLTEDYTEIFFHNFIAGNLDYTIVDLLRDYRNRKNSDIKMIENGAYFKEENPLQNRKIEGLVTFLSQIKFPMANEGMLTSYETQYITGGWFEEYVYNQFVKHIKPQSIAIGLEIKNTDRTNQNDLDVVFTFGNKLFVVECKTGIDGNKMFNETVYKATAIKETVLGLSANTYIFSLASADERFSTIAKNLGIRYYDRSYFENPEKFNELIKTIISTAKN
jgi:hypothetical protein